MAILNSIRKRGIFLIIIIAMALFAFVLTDVINKGGGSGPANQNVIATVNGMEINKVEFNSLVDAAQRTRYRGATTSQVRNIVWEEQVRAAIIKGKLESLGVTAEANFTKYALSQALAQDPTFFNEAGVFDYAKVEEYVRFQKQDKVTYANWLARENDIVERALQIAYLNLINGSSAPSAADGRWAYHMENDKVDIQYVQIPYSTIPDDQAVVTDAEIEAYMRDHQDRFTVPPRVDIQYVLFAGNASASDELAITDEVNALVNDEVNGLRTTDNLEAFLAANSGLPYNNSFLQREQVPATLVDSIWGLEEGEIYGPYKESDFIMATRLVERRTLPDTVSARHILIPIGQNPTDQKFRDEAQAKVTADSLLTILKTDTSKFEEFVTSFSSDSGSIDNGGLYEDFAYNRMVPEFRDFSFENEVGSIGIAQTQFGFHIIEVMDQKGETEVVKLATLSKELKASQQTINDLFAQATTFETNLVGRDFAEVAQENTYGVRPVNSIEKLDENIAGLESQRPIVNWAFQSDTSIGDIKRFDVGDGFAVVQLVRRNEKEALMSNAEGSAVVTPLLRNKKKAELIRQKISGTTLEEIAQNQSQTIQAAQAINMLSPTIAGAATEPRVVGAAFGLKPGEVSKPIDGRNGVYVVRTTAINKAPALEDYSAFVIRAAQAAGNQAGVAAYNALKEAADIEDNRSDFY